jgi:hypothetical protein
MILDKLMRQKRFFDVNEKKDIDAFKRFLKNQAWGKDCCPFMLEEPWLTVPDMIKDKLIRHYLKV